MEQMLTKIKGLFYMQAIASSMLQRISRVVFCFASAYVIVHKPKYHDQQVASVQQLSVCFAKSKYAISKNVFRLINQSCGCHFSLSAAICVTIRVQNFSEILQIQGLQKKYPKFCITVMHVLYNSKTHIFYCLCCIFFYSIDL